MGYLSRFFFVFSIGIFSSGTALASSPCANFLLPRSKVVVQENSASLGQFHREIASLRQVRSTLKKVLTRHAAKKVLLIWDHDATVIRPDSILGGEEYFDWLLNNVQKDPKNKRKLRPDWVKNYSDILVLQMALIASVKMGPTEPVLPDITTEAVKAGVHQLLLTSRNPMLLEFTLNDLAEIGFRKQQTLPGSKRAKGIYLPYDKADPLPYGTSQREIKRLGLDDWTVRQVGVYENILMLRGQHKGLMLKTYLHRIGFEPTAIIFVDDKKKHTQAMFDGFVGSGIEVHSLRYAGSDRAKQEFHEIPTHELVKMVEAVERATPNSDFALYRQRLEYVHGIKSLDPDTQVSMEPLLLPK